MLFFFSLSNIDNKDCHFPIHYNGRSCFLETTAFSTAVGLELHGFNERGPLVPPGLITTPDLKLGFDPECTFQTVGSLSFQLTVIYFFIVSVNVVVFLTLSK